MPPHVADGITSVSEQVRATVGWSNAAKNGMHAWHAGTNAWLAQEFGLAGYPVAYGLGIYHELVPGSFSAEQEVQGSVNHVLDSLGDIGANLFGYVIGMTSARGSGVMNAIRWGNHIPGPGDPAMNFGGAPGYNGDPTRAWGGYE